MSYQSDRESFIAELSAQGFTLAQLRALLRCATTLQRLAEAQCNGDYPADNGVRPATACARCEALWVRSVLVKRPEGLLCPDCRTADRVRGSVPETWKPIFGGDPRGAVLKLSRASTPDADIESGRARTVYVPAR